MEKKLSEIHKLETKSATGETLTKQEIDKVGKKQDFETRLSDLLKGVASLNM